ncbi:unnamed protein product [Vitrella brassicaformis CCMP3155]|uniref:Uncharacterized protein n=1 Tax=Vitrella brassicaformis (strain CCMP3155) TaxID=1169540 RepID=A0A0G4E8A6_VITBC|nr:unnamed protein product [Vitrella brassicaformis CCMP3155]|eukprot:CEL91615.1 unnamed protein product [Vitrella brassicaformis CCMP3155]
MVTVQCANLYYFYPPPPEFTEVPAAKSKPPASHSLMLDLSPATLALTDVDVAPRAAMVDELDKVLLQLSPRFKQQQQQQQQQSDGHTAIRGTQHTQTQTRAKYPDKDCGAGAADAEEVSARDLPREVDVLPEDEELEVASIAKIVKSAVRFGFILVFIILLLAYCAFVHVWFTFLLQGCKNITSAAGPAQFEAEA